MSYNHRLCRICLADEDGNEHFPIFDEDSQIAHKIFLITNVQIEQKDIPAVICAECLKDLSKAINFRNKAIKAEKFFKKSDEITFAEPEIHIKLEDDFIENIKSEPLEEVPHYEFVDENRSFVDVFDKTTTEFYDYNEAINVVAEKKSKRGKEHYSINDFCSSSGIVRCSLCMKTFTSVNSHQNHMKTVHQKINASEMLKCKQCDRVFKLKIYLNRHVARVHKNVSPKIRSVSKKNSTDTIFDKEDVSLYCELCKQFFTTRGSLQKHVRVKHDFVDMKDRFICDVCGQRFLIKYYLIRHIRVRHLKNFVEKKTPDQPTPCEVCGKILKNRGLLKPHMRSHKVMTADDYWYCDLCPRKFKTKGGCTWHIQQRHVLKATFPCKLCPGVVYKGKWELKCHIKSKHTTIRDFKCEICGKGFMDKQKLQIHTRIHTGERPHVCHICPQTFIHQTDLRRHIWGHTGERPYRCGFLNCGKGFMKRSELINHENRCHPIAPPVPQQPHYYAM